MTYRVYQRDIDSGLRADPEYNPVARSIRRRHPTKHVRVENDEAMIGQQRIKLPLRVRLWIKSHEFGCNVRPFRFELLSTTV